MQIIIINKILTYSVHKDIKTICVSTVFLLIYFAYLMLQYKPLFPCASTKSVFLKLNSFQHAGVQKIILAQ